MGDALYPPRGRDSISSPPNSSPGLLSAVFPLTAGSWSLNALLPMCEIIANRVVSRVTAVGSEPLMV